RRNVREQVADRVAVLRVAETPKRRAAGARRRARRQHLFRRLAVQHGGTDDAHAPGAGRRTDADLAFAGDERYRTGDQRGGEAELATGVRHAALLCCGTGLTAPPVRSKTESDPVPSPSRTSRGKTLTLRLRGHTPTTAHLN